MKKQLSKAAMETYIKIFKDIWVARTSMNAMVYMKNTNRPFSLWNDKIRKEWLDRDAYIITDQKIDLVIEEELTKNHLIWNMNGKQLYLLAYIERYGTFEKELSANLLRQAGIKL